MGFSENLRKRREEQQITQVQLAERIGVSQALICQYELGACQPNITMGVLLAKKLDTTCEKLVEG